MHVPLLIIGGGLSGLAAALRFARFNSDVLLLEQHSRLGGLNSYYYRNKRLFETGLHAITNFAHPKDKKAPLNRLLRQLKIKRDALTLHEQLQSKIVFVGKESLSFSNDFALICSEIEKKFPQNYLGFQKLIKLVDGFDPFTPTHFISTRKTISAILGSDLLTDMILCPLMFYGSSVPNDMDLGQFVIMFRAIFQEGMFRPGGTIKDLLDLLKKEYTAYGGKIRTNSCVHSIITKREKVLGVQLTNTKQIHCDYLLSTAGSDETLALLGRDPLPTRLPRLGFVESIFELQAKTTLDRCDKTTILFFNDAKKFNYSSPEDRVDFRSGVICMPQNFQHFPDLPFREVRTTHLASYSEWKKLQKEDTLYSSMKKETALQSLSVAEKILGNFSGSIVYSDIFTPVTVERFTAKKNGAIYGNPVKIKDGDIGYENLFLAGTDQGFLGIVGAMLSGVSIVNQHILPRI